MGALRSTVQFETPSAVLRRDGANGGWLFVTIAGVVGGESDGVVVVR